MSLYYFGKKYAVKKTLQKMEFAALCCKFTFLHNFVGTIEKWTKINVHFFKVLELYFFFYLA